MKKIRNSNIEILRIISIFLIILNHFSGYGNFEFENNLEINSVIIDFLHLGGKLGVNIFLFISGWYLCDSKRLNIKRPFFLMTEVLFYSILFSCTGIILGTLTFKQIVKMILAIPFGEWEFITCYFMMVCFSYWINKLIHCLSKNQFLILIIFILFVWCIIPTFIKADFGMSTLTWYIFIYMIAAYIKNIYTKINLTSTKCFIIGILSYTIILISEIVFKLIGLRYEIFINHYDQFRSLNSLFILITTVFLFLGFEKIRPKENFIVQKIASTSLAIFIIHDNGALRNFVWNDIFHTSDLSSSKFLLVYSLIISLSIFLFGMVIDLIRQETFGKIERKILEGKIDKYQEKLNQFLES